MNIRAPAILCAVRAQGENAAIARMLTADHGLIAGYVAGGRGRRLRPVLIPGNLVSAEIRARSESQLPFARLELVESRGPWLTEPLPAAGIGWATALTATVLPERQAYPALYEALDGALAAICAAPSARRWVGALLDYETLLLREMGYGAPEPSDRGKLARFDALGRALSRHLLADWRSDVMAARTMLRERLARMVTE